MSVEVTFPVWKWSKQKGARLLLLVAIADYANAEGIAWPSIASLSKRIRMSTRYVQIMLREIEKDGELEIVKRTQTSNVYRVRIKQPPMEQLPGELEFAPPLQPASPAPEPGFAKGANPASPNPLGNRNRTVSDVVDSEAESIYLTYPKKVGRKTALKSIERAMKAFGADKLMAATVAYAEAVKLWPEADRQYVPHPATWFNQGRYEDDPSTWKRFTHENSQKPNGRGFGNSRIDDYARYGEQLAAQG